MASLIALVYIFKRKSSMLDSKLSTKKERCKLYVRTYSELKPGHTDLLFLAEESKKVEKIENSGGNFQKLSRK